MIYVKFFDTRQIDNNFSIYISFFNGKWGILDESEQNYLFHLIWQLSFSFSYSIFNADLC